VFDEDRVFGIGQGGCNCQIPWLLVFSAAVVPCSSGDRGMGLHDQGQGGQARQVG
jgi:hypothetical protein